MSNLFPESAAAANDALLRQTYYCQTKFRGSDDAEYQIYVSNAKSLGWYVKTFEEWKAS